MRTKSCLCIVAAALVGILFPTSANGDISTPLSLGAVLIPALFLSLTIRLNGWQQARIGYLILLLGLVLLFTTISPFSYIAWGGAASYILASIVLLVDFRPASQFSDAKVDLYLILAVVLIDFCILTLGFGILADESILVEIVRQNYQSLSEELYEQMVVWYSKPVTVFGSHSTAALAYFALFVLNIKIFKSLSLPWVWRLFFLLSAVGFVVLNWFLKSNTSTAMAILMVMFLAFKPIKLLPRTLLLALFPWVAVFVAVTVFDSSLLQSVLGESEGNGFLARYTSGGRLQNTYDYLIDNYFLPIGFSYSPELGLGDNFIAEYVVKTSPFGYFLILYLLWGWFRRHLGSPRYVFFFGFFLLADLAYPLLVYGRIAAALPFFVLLWQRLDSENFLSKSRGERFRFVF